MADLHGILLSHFGSQAFRPGQEVLTEALLHGRDVLGSLPDGGGKSLCWQAAAWALPGLTLVLSPFPQELRRQAVQLSRSGLSALFLDREGDPEGYRDALQKARSGAYRVVCTTPDALDGPDLLALACSVPVSLVAVEEAHCSVPWGPEFRPEYRLIPDFIRLLPTRPVVAAFTPMAEPELGRELGGLLLLRDPLCVTEGYGRRNLALDVAAPRRKDPWLLDFVKNRPGQSGVVCCGSRQTAENLCRVLQNGGISAVCAHCGLESQKVRAALDDYLADHVQVLVAADDLVLTLDKPNIRFMVHYNLPTGPDDYDRQLNRAGRDGEPAYCVLLFSPADVQAARLRARDPGITEEGRHRMLRQLDRLVEYCKTTRCLRTQLLGSLGQEPGLPCGCCGNCTCKYVCQDITREARLILTAVGHIESRFAFGLGRALIVLMLQGADDRRVRQMGLDQMEGYGVLSALSRPQIRAYIDALIREGCLYTTEGEFPVLRRTELGVRALKRGENFVYKVRMKRQNVPHTRPRLTLSQEETALARELQALRTAIAHELGLPAYVIFSNATLEDMAHRQPRTEAELLQVAGVGKIKAQRYGPRFLDCIQRWTAEQSE